MAEYEDKKALLQQVFQNMAGSATNAGRAQEEIAGHVESAAKDLGGIITRLETLIEKADRLVAWQHRARALGDYSTAQSLVATGLQSIGRVPTSADGDRIQQGALELVQALGGDKASLSEVLVFGDVQTSAQGLATVLRGKQEQLEAFSREELAAKEQYAEPLATNAQNAINNL